MPAASIGGDSTGRRSRRGNRVRYLGQAFVSSAIIPLLGDAAVAGNLALDLGDISAGTPTARSFTTGPKLKETRMAPAFPTNTTKGGSGGWWNVSAKQTLQDYRSFSPVHRDGCHILFADGSVRAYADSNSDGFLNNGFEPYQDGFTSDEDELGEHEVASGYSLTDIP